MHAYLLTNGRVLVGKRDGVSPERTFQKAWLVEKWGTTEGICQLAKGPTETTIRSVVHDVVLPPEGFVFALNACDKAWKI